MAKISFITTVKNDSEGLKILIESLERQTRLPDEIVVVNGAKKGLNRSQGRNKAIKKAKGEIIVVSDAGCILVKDWLEKITTPFKNKKVDVVAGFYEPITENIFQECLANYTCSHYSLPSSRSIAFRKKTWQKVGGYPEKLDYCEDLIFAERLKKAEMKFVFEPKAVVYWPQRKNLSQTFKQFFNYAEGDAQALYWPHLRKIGLVFARYGLGIWLWIQSWQLGLAALGFYLAWAIKKNCGRVKHLLVLIYLPLLQIISDLAVMSGAIRGIILR